MKVAVFENEYNLIKTIIDTTNYYYFNNAFDFDNFPSSQSIGTLEKIEEYSLILIDIDLSAKSDVDGYSLISKILKIKTNPNIIIVTGHSKVKENLKNKDLPDFPILYKPLTIENLKKTLEPFAKIN